MTRNRREMLASKVLRCPCGGVRVLEPGEKPESLDYSRGPMRPHGYFTRKTYRAWFALDHRTCVYRGANVVGTAPRTLC